MHEPYRWFILATVALATYGCGDSGGDGDTSVADTGMVDGAADTGTEDTGAGDAATACVRDWSCLGSVSIPAPMSAEAVISGRVEDFLAASAEAGLMLEVCRRSDPDCADPITATTDDSGRFEVRVPIDPDPFWGFIRMTPSGGRTHEIFGSMPIYEDTGILTAVVPANVVTAAGAVAGEMQDWDANGFVVILPVECPTDGVGMYACGVHLEITSGSGTLLYGGEIGALTTTATETGEVGGALLLNAVPGDYVVEAYRASDDTLSGTVEFPVRASTITFAYIPPTPGGTAYSP